MHKVMSVHDKEICSDTSATGCGNMTPLPETQIAAFYSWLLLKAEFLLAIYYWFSKHKPGKLHIFCCY